MKIGFVGLGIMGKPMVKNLIKANKDVLVNDLNKEAEKEVEALGAKVVSIEEMARDAEVMITMLPNGAIVKSVLYSGETAVLNQSEINVKMVIDMSSLTPNESLEISKVLEEKDIQYVDAPVSGGEPLAITGELAVMVGCDEDLLEDIKEVLRPIA